MSSKHRSGPPAQINQYSRSMRLYRQPPTPTRHHAQNSLPPTSHSVSRSPQSLTKPQIFSTRTFILSSLPVLPLHSAHHQYLFPPNPPPAPIAMSLARPLAPRLISVQVQYPQASDPGCEKVWCRSWPAGRSEGGDYARDDGVDEQDWICWTIGQPVAGNAIRDE